MDYKRLTKKPKKTLIKAKQPSNVGAKDSWEGALLPDANISYSNAQQIHSEEQKKEVFKVERGPPLYCSIPPPNQRYSY